MEDNLDRLAQRLLTAVSERQITRLVIDGLDGFRAAAVHPERLSRFFMALVHELRAREVTTVFTLELPGVVGPIVTLPVSSVSTIIDNLILLRHVEVGAQTHRLISIMEARDSDYDPAVREFAIGEQGMTVAANSESAARLLRTEAGPHVWEQGPRPAE
jgi:circadian clock protein KaiC